MKRKIRNVIVIGAIAFGAFGVGNATAYDPEVAFVTRLTACAVVREARARGYDPAISIPATYKVCLTPTKGVIR